MRRYAWASGCSRSLTNPAYRHVICKTAAVGHEAASGHKVMKLRNRWHRMADRQHGKLPLRAMNNGSAPITSAPDPSWSSVCPRTDRTLTKINVESDNERVSWGIVRPKIGGAQREASIFACSGLAGCLSVAECVGSRLVQAGAGTGAPTSAELERVLCRGQCKLAMDRPGDLYCG